MKIPGHGGLLILGWLPLLFLLRVIGLFVISSDLSEVSATELAYGLYLGSKFDLRVLCVLALPMFILDIWMPAGRLKWIYRSYFSVVGILFFLVYGTDFGNLSYLGTRVTYQGIELLNSPLIAFQMLSESYPIIEILLGGLALVVLQWWLLARWQASKSFFEGRSVLQKLGLSFVWIVILGAGFYGKVGYYPLRWSEAFFSTHAGLGQLSLNPVAHVVDTYRYRRRPINHQELAQHFKVMRDYLNRGAVEGKRFHFRKHIPPVESSILSKSNGRAPNIVIVQMESLAWDKSSVSNNPLDPTPALKRYARDGILFTRFFTPTEATARAVFATMTGTPDVSKVKTGSRNPLIVDQHSIFNAFKDYQKFYFLGGSANWGNVRGIFSNNVQGVQILEEGSYSSPRVDVWGISDLDLFMEADAIFRKQTKPFIAYVQSSGFHRPYTIPGDARAFKPKLVPSEQLRSHGFQSLEEYNSLRFQDYAMELFLETAQKSKYFENTIFVFFGDHGLVSLKSNHIPGALLGSGLTRHHVPLLVYAPAMIGPQRVERAASQIDILPTVAGLVGLPYTNTTLGRDLFDPHTIQNEGAFTYTWHSNPSSYGFVKGDYFFLHSGVRSGLYNLTKGVLEDESGTNPALYADLKVMAESFLRLSDYMMSNNSKSAAKQE